MAYFSENKNITGKVKIQSGLLDLNEWTGTQAEPQTTVTGLLFA